MDKLTKDFNISDLIVKNIDEQDGSFSGICTMSTTDMEDEVVLAEGLDWEYFQKHKWMYFNHDYESDPVARLKNVKYLPNKKAWWIEGAFLKSSYRAREIYEMAKEVGAIGVSIGFKALERSKPTAEERKMYGPIDVIVKKAKVLETSIVFMPAHKDALAILAKKLEKQDKISKGFAQQFEMDMNSKTIDLDELISKHIDLKEGNKEINIDL